MAGTVTGPGSGSDEPRYLGLDLDAMSVADRYSREIVRGFSPYLGQRVAEVGAGTGNISVLLLERGLTELLAIEPDHLMHERLAERLKPHANAVAYKGLLAAAIEQSRIGVVDSVVSVNVLEHVENDVEELARMHSVLRPGGHLCLWVPAVPALYSRFDRMLGHHRRYRKSELAVKIRRAGFEILRLGYRDLVGLFAWFLCCRVLGRGLTRGTVGLYDRLVVPATSAVGRWVHPPLGKNLLAVARRP